MVLSALALVAALVGFGIDAPDAVAGIARILFAVFIVGFAICLLVDRQK